MSYGLVLLYKGVVLRRRLVGGMICPVCEGARRMRSKA